MQAFIDDIDKAIKSIIAENRIPGLIVCVRAGDTHEDRILYSKAHGSDALNVEVAINENNLFHIASQSKTFTSASILWLVERERLKLTDKLLDLLPVLKQHPDHSHLVKVTVKHLMEHRAPLAMKNPWPLDEKAPYPSTADLSGPTLFSFLDRGSLKNGIGKPGYSNPSYWLLGAIVGKVARSGNLGSTFSDFVRKTFLDPHGLTEIHPGLGRAEIENMENIAQGYYLVRDGTLRPSIKPAFRGCVPAGGFYGTAEQLSKFYHLLLTPGEILTENSLDMMKNFSRESPYGMGLSIFGSRLTEFGMKLSRFGTRITGSASEWFGHEGTFTGCKSRTMHKDGVTISMMMPLGTLPIADDPDILCWTPREDPRFPRLPPSSKKR